MPLIDCPNCCGLPDLMPACHWCRGAGKLVDHPAPVNCGLERWPIAIASGAPGHVVAQSNDGKLWSIYWDHEVQAWGDWFQLPALPQPDVPAPPAQPEVTL